MLHTCTRLYLCYDILIVKTINWNLTISIGNLTESVRNEIRTSSSSFWHVMVQYFAFQSFFCYNNDWLFQVVMIPRPPVLKSCIEPLNVFSSWAARLHITLFPLTNARAAWRLLQSVCSDLCLSAAVCSVLSANQWPVLKPEQAHKCQAPGTLMVTRSHRDTSPQ